jgi:hemoglobin
MRDIETPEDIYAIVSEFYKKLLADGRIRYVFTDVVPVIDHLEEHLQILVTFWSQALLGTGGYYNNMVGKHFLVNEKSPLTPALFEIWLDHFRTTIDENFAGAKADDMKAMAGNMAVIMQIKLGK